MRLYGRCVMAAGAAAMLVSAGVAEAGTTRIRFDITGEALPTVRRAVPAGGVNVSRFDGHFDVLFDDAAGTLTFVDFTGAIPTAGGLATISMAEPGQVLSVGSTSGASQLVHGSLDLVFDTGDGDRATVAFQFKTSPWGQLANRFFDRGQPTGEMPAALDGAYGLGLLGSGLVSGGDVFGGATRVRMNVFASGQLVPLPGPAGLALVGLGVGAGARRRR